MMYVYIYIYILFSLSPSLSLHIYIYIYTYVGPWGRAVRRHFGPDLGREEPSRAGRADYQL